MDCFAAIVFQLWMASAMYKFVGMRRAAGAEISPMAVFCFSSKRECRKPAVRGRT